MRKPPPFLKGDSEPIEKQLLTVKSLIGAIVLLVSAGASSVIYLSRYALATEERSHFEETAKRLSGVETRQAVLEALQHNIEEDLHWQREQASETARRVGARVVPSPSHGP